MYDQLYPVTYYFYPLLEHAFAESPNRDYFLKMLSEPKAKVTENLLYIHIPYCHDLCRFCPFHVKVTKQDEVYVRYTKALIKEIEMISVQPYVSDMTFGAVYFGGGSPSILNNVLLKKIFESIFRCFNLKTDAEISFEGEPRTLGEPEKLDLLKDFNVKRISFGLQTYKQEMRDLFKIVATLDDIDNVIRNARDRNFHEINVDMMYDLPNQTLTDLEYDLKHLAEHDFDSIDYYNLHYYAFPEKMKVDMFKSKPSDKMHFILGEQLSARLIDMGYNHVADQIFTKESQVCEYFRLLWGGGYGDHTAETIAIGASARGYINGVSYMNYGNTNKYLKLVEENEFVFDKISTRLEKPENRGAAFFPKFYQINKEYAPVMKTIPENILKLWVDNGLAFEIDGAWYLSQKGKSWTTNMMVDGFEPIQRKKAFQSTKSLVLKAGMRTGSF